MDQSFHLQHVPILLIIGSAIFGGSIGARIFQKLRIPQVVGYIIIGLIVGRSGFGLIGEEEIQNLLPFNFFALGIIGFMIGGELHRHTFKKFGRQFLKILLAEGLTAFAFVTLLTGLLAWLISGNFLIGLSFGLILGAIASATAPAATVDVLWEYKTRGILTTTVLAIVALDDGLALLLYSFASSVALRLSGADEASFLVGFLHTFYEIGRRI